MAVEEVLLCSSCLGLQEGGEKETREVRVKQKEMKAENEIEIKDHLSCGRKSGLAVAVLLLEAEIHHVEGHRL